ncbi:hypothetical protein OS493_032071 [Desmophyllum pertusum]|uniref:G-protein coupled receptors family 3 profile domain-containing protein n=1 Tax=Desmophyllum pertusum TaxID=174260 RepID=A0A9W9YW34_9CNID|nr:hypothetical protein OS493_032071 [Desmophyllum pertusum]
MVGQSQCCWNCQKCDKGKVSFKSGSLACTLCNDTHYANTERTQCVLREVVYLKFSDAAGISIITLSCVGMAVLTAVTVIFIRERKTPVVMDSSPYLLILFFITLYLSFFLTIIQVTSKPTDSSCSAVSVLLLLIFVFYAAFFLAKSKTATQLLQSAVSRVTNMRTAYLQLVEVGVIVVLQAILIIAWQASSLSVARFLNQEDNTRLLEWLRELPGRSYHRYLLSNHCTCAGHAASLPRETSTRQLQRDEVHKFLHHRSLHPSCSFHSDVSLRRWKQPHPRGRVSRCSWRHLPAWAAFYP